MAATTTEAALELVLDGEIRPVAGDEARAEALLPSAVPQSHAANLLPLSNGDLACVWFAGTQEGLPDISIYWSKLKAGEAVWSEAVKLSDDPGHSEQNPVLFPAPDGRLWLLYTSQDFGNQDTSVIKYRISEDGGESWGPIGQLFEDQGVFIRQRIVVLDNGDWLLPIFLCRPNANGKWDGSNDTSAVRISSDRGRNWTQYNVPDSLGAVHMNVLKTADGLVAFYRSRWADFILRSTSRDGRVWSAPVATPLPNNNSSIQVSRLASGRLAVVYNHKSAADSVERRRSLYDEIDGGGETVTALRPDRAAVWGVPRAPLSIALSEDDGVTWRFRRDIETGDGYCLSNESREASRNRELSYPTVTQSADGTVHVAYTYFRRAIKYVRLSEDWAMQSA
ncbi:exo-alpha-sialidase [Kaistia dalseonensis]|uniref:Neuraminidase n=1 Tax=Kaistia dalseonensis TaxID=410840 RepID=A0ABU0HCW2_9HYPH|nr:exo-alpha-sialidase [Kaistia dalseonensis]MCX5496708.1 exo-alpha-sialidase [Kaistia dalseonensis]MDQ0439334.1 putative neuraminidase [Kaistia dalseonensis]